MKIAIDTGFFLRYLEGHPKANQIWQETIASQHTLTIPTITLNEVFTHFFQRGLGTVAQQLFEILTSTPGFELVALSGEIAIDSARYRVGMQLSTVDSVILSTALLNQCDLLITSDGDLNQPAIKNLIPVELLSK